MDSRKPSKKKPTEKYRNYDNEPGVERTYKRSHENQSTFFAKRLNKDFGRHRVRDVFEFLEKIVDESDPDAKFPQIFHAYQTGEALKSYLSPDDPTKLKPDLRVRDFFTDNEWEALPLEWRQSYPTYMQELYPHIIDWSWLPLIGFLHDIGKVLAAPEWGSFPQWAVVGDTFPLTVPFSSSNVYADKGFYKNNPQLNMADNEDKFSNLPRNCGFDKLQMSCGHDEYGYRVLHNAIHHLPEEALYIVRYHSFYPWHTPQNGIRGYTEFASEKDKRNLILLRAFQKSDLYSKVDELPSNEQMKKYEEYYFGLLEQFVPGRIQTPYNLRPAKLSWRGKLNR